MSAADPMPWGALVLALWPLWLALGVVLGTSAALWLAERRSRLRVRWNAHMGGYVIESKRPLTQAEAEELLAAWRARPPYHDPGLPRPSRRLASVHLPRKALPVSARSAEGVAE